MRFFNSIFISIFISLLCVTMAYSQAPVIVSMSPAQYELNVSADVNISVVFDSYMEASTINDSTFLVYGEISGFYDGIITYDNPTKTAVFDPSDNFLPGEVVSVILTNHIYNLTGTALTRGFNWSFRIGVNSGQANYTYDTSYPVGNTPIHAIFADYNGDKSPDIATANSFSDNTTILINNGDGVFPDISDYPTGLNPTKIASADYDNDGDLDIAAVNNHSYDVSVLFNNGDGTFVNDSIYPVNGNATFIIAADLNNDGHIDLVTVNNNAKTISILLNNGNGVFSAQVIYSIGYHSVRGCAIDFDLDGDIDIATANHLSNNVVIMSNDGNGVFSHYATFATGSYPVGITITDVNSDLFPDLATGNYSSHDVSIILNNGDGSFAPYVSYPVGNTAGYIITSDFNSDGNLDLATVNGPPGTVSLLLNNSIGTSFTHRIYALPTEPHSIRSADIDNDGDLDLATSDGSYNSVSILKNEEICDKSVLIITSNNQHSFGVTFLSGILSGLSLNLVINPSSYNFSDYDIVIGDGNMWNSTKVPDIRDYVENSGNLVMTAATPFYLTNSNTNLSPISDIIGANHYLNGYDYIILKDDNPYGLPYMSDDTLGYANHDGGRAGISQPIDSLFCRAYWAIPWSSDSSLYTYGYLPYTGKYFYMSTCPSDSTRALFKAAIEWMLCTNEYGQPSAVLSPDPQFYMLAYTYIPFEDTIFLGNFNDYSISDVDLSSLKINDAILPTSIEITTGYEGFEDSVAVITFPAHNFILGYGLWFDTSEKAFVVSGKFNDCCPFIVNGTFTVIGHRSGDVNNDNEVNIFDISYILNYLYNGGTEPKPLEIADINSDNMINLYDITYLISYLYFDGQPPNSK